MWVPAAGFLPSVLMGMVAFLGCAVCRVGAAGAALDVCIKGCVCAQYLFSVKRAAWEMQVSLVRASVRSQTNL